MREYVYIEAEIDHKTTQIEFGSNLGKTKEQWLKMSYDEQREWLDQWMKESMFAPEAYIDSFSTLT